jgi:hypothetical protein
LAQTPRTNEEFLREVDEQVRLDTALQFWRRWGRWIIGGIIAALLGFAGWLWWGSHRNAVAGVEGENFAAAIDSLEAGRMTKAETELKALNDSDAPGYRASSQMALAALKLAKNDIKGAITAYDKVSGDGSLGQPFRDAATIRGVAAGFDTMKPGDVIARLKPLAVPGNAWFGSAGEMTAIAYMKMNKPREAGAMFAAIAKDEGVPESIRSRSVQLEGVLGVDVTPAGAKGGNDK